MHVIKRSTILDYCNQHPDAAEQLLAWLKEAEHAIWTRPNDIKERYKSADFPGNHRVVLNIKGNNYRFVFAVHYANEISKGTVYVRWFGSHAEYNRINVETI